MNKYYNSYKKILLNLKHYNNNILKNLKKIKNMNNFYNNKQMIKNNYNHQI